MCEVKRSDSSRNTFYSPAQCSGALYVELHGWLSLLRNYDLLPPEVSSMKYCHLGVFRKEY